jgi:ribosomal protein L37E
VGTDFANRVLVAWERGLMTRPAERAAILLETLTSAEADEVSAMTLGRRDESLLALRRSLFGPQLSAHMQCRSCGERMHAEFHVGQLLEALHPAQADVTWREGSTEVSLRSPTVADLRAASGAADVESAWQIVIRRCVTFAESSGRRVEAGELSPEVLERAGTLLEEAGAKAHQVIEVACAACGRAHDYALDVAAFLWEEIQIEARRLLHEVARLSRGYGWREADVLAMSAIRRRAYLEMLPA